MLDPQDWEIESHTCPGDASPIQDIAAKPTRLFAKPALLHRGESDTWPTLVSMTEDCMRTLTHNKD